MNAKLVIELDEHTTMEEVDTLKKILKQPFIREVRLEVN